MSPASRKETSAGAPLPLSVGLLTPFPPTQMVFNKSGRAPDMKQILADMEARKKAEGQGVSAAVEAAKADKKPYQMVRISVLREYLVGDLGGRQPLPFERDNERILDDFVFLCFFCGNDFLPHMPTLEIREGAIDLLMTVYRNLLPTMGYLCEGSEVNLERVQIFVKEVAKFESVIFQKRGRMLNNQKSRRRREKAQAEAAKRFQEQQGGQQGQRHMGPPGTQLHQSNQSAADALKQKLAGKHTRFDGGGEDANPSKKAKVEPEGAHKEGSDGADEGKSTGGGEGSNAKPEATEGEKIQNLQNMKDQLAKIVKDKGDMMDDLIAKPDQIRLNEAGFRERYYETKFHVKPGPEQEALIRNIVEKYVEGLCWVMKYYYEGCASWKWFYPYHYAPFASDLVDIKDLNIEFEKGEPFKPFEQLMGVLPAASSHALPAAHQAVMKDPNSDIADFYPTDFKIDMNGKRFQWQAVVLLPWIEEKRLLEASRALEDTLTDEEKRRNSQLTTLLFVSHLHPLAQQIKSLEKTRQEQGLEDARLSEKMDPEKSKNMNGVLELPIGTICPEKIHSNYDAMPDITGNKALTAVYRFPAPHKHLPAILKGTILPESVVQDRDIPPPAQLWHEDRPRRHVPGLFGVPGAAGSRHGMHLGNNNPGMSPFQGPPPGRNAHVGGGRGWGPPPGQPGAYPPPPQQHSYPPPPQQQQHSYPPPPQGHHQHQQSYPPQGYPPQGYPPQGYAPPHPGYQQPPPGPGYNPAYLNHSTHGQGGQGGGPPRQPPQFGANNPYGALQNNPPQ